MCLRRIFWHTVLCLNIQANIRGYWNGVSGFWILQWGRWKVCRGSRSGVLLDLGILEGRLLHRIFSEALDFRRNFNFQLPVSKP